VAKRSSVRRVRESIVSENTGESPPETVRLVSVVGAGKYIITGLKGKEYTFIGNQPLEVNIDDAEYFLTKRQGCCGSSPQPIFVKV